MGTGHSAGRAADDERAHAVPTDIADGPAPWLAVCGVSVGLVQGSWAGRRGLGAEQVCAECRRLVPE
jgi:hypothetical protein